MDYAVLSPLLDQSYALASLIRRYEPVARVSGLYLPDEVQLAPGRWPSRLYDALGTLGMEMESAAATGAARCIPTGSRSTMRLLESGDVTLGEITLTRESARAADKPWMLEQAAGAGVPVPHTWRCREDVSEYPVFYKPRHDTFARVRGIAEDPGALPPAEEEEEEELLFQEYIASPGTYGVGFLADGGVLRAIAVHFERESLPRSGGSAVVIEAFEDGRLVEHTARLVARLAYSGWGLAEFKYCPRREDYVFMEINAKFWASCEFSFALEPAFLRLLFGWKPKKIGRRRVTFVHRLFARDDWYAPAQLRLLLDWPSLRVYPGCARALAYNLTPRALRGLLKPGIVKTPGALRRGAGQG